MNNIAHFSIFVNTFLTPAVEKIVFFDRFFTLIKKRFTFEKKCAIIEYTSKKSKNKE